MTDSEMLAQILDHVRATDDMTLFWQGFGPVFGIGIVLLCYKFITSTYNDSDL